MLSLTNILFIYSCISHLSQIYSPPSLLTRPTYFLRGGDGCWTDVALCLGDERGWWVTFNPCMHPIYRCGLLLVFCFHQHGLLLHDRGCCSDSGPICRLAGHPFHDFRIRPFGCTTWSVLSSSFDLFRRGSLVSACDILYHTLTFSGQWNICNLFLPVL